VAGGSGGHRRRGDPPRLSQGGKRKLTESAREFPKAFRLSGPEEKTVSDTPFPLKPDGPSMATDGPALVSNAPLCSELYAIRSLAGCSKRPSSKAAGGARTGGVPSGAHGATNKEHQVCARRRVSEAAGSPLRILVS
jgi:hypothetical protein